MHSPTPLKSLLSPWTWLYSQERGITKTWPLPDHPRVKNDNYSMGGGGGRDIKNEPISLLLIEYTEAKINLGRGRSCWQQRFLTFEERILFTEWSYKVDQKHSLNSSSNNIKTITINHFPMEGSLVYMKLSEVSLIHIKGTTLYTQKKSAIKLTREWER